MVSAKEDLMHWRLNDSTRHDHVGSIKRTTEVKDRNGEPERETMGADKNSSRRRWKLQQDEHGFQHTSPTHYPSWPSPHSHWSATGPRNQQTTFRAKTHQHAQRKLARLAACAPPVRPMACTGQTDGLRRSDRWTELVRPMAIAAAQQMFQKSSVTSLGPGTKTSPKHNL
jgi:hypothetical protein